MEYIGSYVQIEPFVNAKAGTSEWCIAQKDGKKYFVKKLLKPVYPSKDLESQIYSVRLKRFEETKQQYINVYEKLRKSDRYGTLSVPVEVCTYNNHLCIISNFVEANTKPDEVCKFDDFRKIVLLRTITLALQNVHAAGWVHSDIKPDNLLIFQDKSKGSCIVKLIDFDSGFNEKDPPKNHEDVFGDLPFFAPEVYRFVMGEPINLNHKIDVFALGLVFHYFWSGTFPEKEKGDTVGQCLARGGKVRINNSIPRSIARIIQQMLVSDPDKRSDCESIYQQLGEVLNVTKPKIIVNYREPETRNRPCINVIYRDKNNKSISSYQIVVYPQETPYTLTIKATEKSPAGYFIPTGHQLEHVFIDKYGNPSRNEVIFRCEKISELEWKTPPKRTGEVIFWVLIVFLFLFLMFLPFIMSPEFHQKLSRILRQIF